MPLFWAVATGTLPISDGVIDDVDSCSSEQRHAGRGGSRRVKCDPEGYVDQPRLLHSLLPSAVCPRDLGHWTPHKLRHSAASIMLAQGTPLWVVSEVPGDASVAITKDIYGYLIGSEKQKATEAITDVLLDHPVTGVDDQVGHHGA